MSNTLWPPVLGFVAYSGTGKTTLLVKLLPILKDRGLRVAVIKHAHHNFDVDRPGKDSYELRKAGATQMLVASSRRWALMVENEQLADPRLQALLSHLDRDTVDLVLVEGFKQEVFPKIELYRAVVGSPPLYPDDASVIAVASDEPLPIPTSLPILDINRPGVIADFIQERVLTAKPSYPFVSTRP